ncbi:MAG TPA: hypothetical protein VIK78_18050, partial [Ruminiclostridium sp.]
FLDYTVSDEFVEMTRYGIDGVDFTKEGDKYTITRAKDKDGKYEDLKTKYKFLPGNLFAAQWFTDVNPNDPTFPQELNDTVSGLKDWAAKNATFITPNFKAAFDTNEKKSILNSIQDNFINIIVSKEDVQKMYDKSVEDYKANGLDKLIDEVNTAIAK